MSKRVNVDFSDEIYEVLTEIADARHKTRSDVLRDAIGLEKLLVDTHREGGRLLVERPGQQLRELLVR